MEHIKSGVVRLSTLKGLNRWDAGFVLAYEKHKENILRLCKMVSSQQLRKLCQQLPYDSVAYQLVGRRSHNPGVAASAHSVFSHCNWADREMATYLCMVFNSHTANEEVQRIRAEAEKKENEVLSAMSVLGLLDQPGLFDGVTDAAT